MDKRITSRKDLEALREEAQAEMDIRTGPKKMEITVHMGTCGIAAGGRDILSELAAELSRARREDVSLRKSGCLGRCDQEPMMTVTEPSGDRIIYGKLDRRKVREIVREHVLGGHRVKSYVVKS